MNGEYKPGLKGWLFSVIIAAGFGSLIADGVKHAFIEWREKDANLVLRVKTCETTTTFVCNYYLENIGDKTTYITKIIHAGKEYNRFHTNEPIDVFASDLEKAVRAAHVAVAKPKIILMIGLEVREDTKDLSTCFYNADKSLLCI